jgi:hypothetical protein
LGKITVYFAGGATVLAAVALRRSIWAEDWLRPDGE